METQITIRTDGTFVNSESGAELTLQDVVKISRSRRKDARAAAAAQRAAAKADRKAIQLAKLTARKAKLEKQLAALAA